jgi:hypothetical protein
VSAGATVRVSPASATAALSLSLEAVWSLTIIAAKALTLSLLPKSRASLAASISNMSLAASVSTKLCGVATSGVGTSIVAAVSVAVASSVIRSSTASLLPQARQRERGGGGERKSEGHRRVSCW